MISNELFIEPNCLPGLDSLDSPVDRASATVGKFPAKFSIHSFHVNQGGHIGLFISDHC